MSDMVTIQIPKKAHVFLHELATRIRDQDNRGTAKPYFLVLRQEKWRPCHDHYSSGDTRRRRLDYKRGDPCAHNSKAEYTQWLKDHDYDLSEDEIEREWDEMEVVTEEQYFEEDNVFFTDAAYERHLELNGHNVREPRHSYLKHAFRNPEMAGLFEALEAFL